MLAMSHEYDLNTHIYCAMPIESIESEKPNLLSTPSNEEWLQALSFSTRI